MGTGHDSRLMAHKRGRRAIRQNRAVPKEPTGIRIGELRRRSERATPLEQARQAPNGKPGNLLTTPMVGRRGLLRAAGNRSELWEFYF
jgi:hypothetical protein